MRVNSKKKTKKKILSLPSFGYFCDIEPKTPRHLKTKQQNNIKIVVFTLIAITIQYAVADQSYSTPVRSERVL